MRYVETRQEGSFFVFTGWTVVANVGGQISALDENGPPYARHSEWSSNGSEDFSSYEQGIGKLLPIISYFYSFIQRFKENY